MLQQARRTPEQFTELAAELFRVMAAGGRVGFEAVAWGDVPCAVETQRQLGSRLRNHR